MAGSAFSRPRQPMDKRRPTLNKQPSNSASVSSARSRSLSLSRFILLFSEGHMCFILFCFFSFPPAPLYYIYYAWVLYYMLIYTKRKKRSKNKNKKHLSVVHSCSPWLPTLGPLWKEECWFHIKGVLNSILCHSLALCQKPQTELWRDRKFPKLVWLCCPGYQAIYIM